MEIYGPTLPKGFIYAGNEKDPGFSRSKFYSQHELTHHITLRKIKMEDEYYAALGYFIKEFTRTEKERTNAINEYNSLLKSLENPTMCTSERTKQLFELASYIQALGPVINHDPEQPKQFEFP